MALLSNVDFIRETEDSFSIEGFDKENLSPNSYDIPVGDIYEVSDEGTKDYILEIHRRLGSGEIHTELSFPVFNTRRMRKVKGRRVVPRKVYVAGCPKIKTVEGLCSRILPRSSSARDGVHVFNPNANGWAAIVPYAHATVTGKPAQLVIYESETKPLSAAEMRMALENRKLFSSNPDVLSDGRGYAYIPVHFANDLRKYNGGTLGNGDSHDRFVESLKPGIFEFYLGLTRESFGTSDEHVLWMFSNEGNMYPNAPLCHANVAQQQHTLEVSLAPEEVRRIAEGRKPLYACSLYAYALRTPASKKYEGSFNGQTEPQPNITF